MIYKVYFVFITLSNFSLGIQPRVVAWTRFESGNVEHIDAVQWPSDGIRKTTIMSSKDGAALVNRGNRLKSNGTGRIRLATLPVS